MGDSGRFPHGVGRITLLAVAMAVVWALIAAALLNSGAKAVSERWSPAPPINGQYVPGHVQTPSVAPAATNVCEPSGDVIETETPLYLCALVVEAPPDRRASGTVDEWTHSSPYWATLVATSPSTQAGHSSTVPLFGGGLEGSLSWIGFVVERH